MKQFKLIVMSICSVLLVWALSTGPAAAQTITEIIDATGDRAGNPLDGALGITVDSYGNVYVTGAHSNNAFKVTPGGFITEIIDATGDGDGNTLRGPWGIPVDGSGNVYVRGIFSNNAFKITPGGVITEIIDAAGDGAGNTLNSPADIAVDGSGNVYVTGLYSENAFKIAFALTITSTSGANGSITPSGNVSVNNGGSQSFSITPNTGYIVADVLVDGVSVGAVTSYTFFNVTSDHTISVTFKISSMAMKQAAKDLLISYLTDSNKKVRKAAKKAIKHIDKSLEAKLWVDVNHLTKKGKKVFDEEKKAVKKLTDKKFTPPFSVDALVAINFLLTADNNLAQVAINEVLCGGNSKCEKELQKANKEMAKALVELSKNKYDKAIEHYKKAWEHAQKAGKGKEDDDEDDDNDDDSIANNKEKISLDNTTNVPVDFSLNQNYPNPFNPTTIIRFALPEASFVSLKIYNMLGEEIKTLVNSDKSAGTYTVQWNGDNNFGIKVASGTYIYRVIAGSNVVSKKMILLR